VDRKPRLSKQLEDAIKCSLALNNADPEPFVMDRKRTVPKERCAKPVRGARLSCGLL
jgi:hypothetical protein